MTTKEKKVYVFPCDNSFDFRKFERIDDFDTLITEAERTGNIYSLSGFQDAINDEELELFNSFIFIN